LNRVESVFKVASLDLFFLGEFAGLYQPIIYGDNMPFLDLKGYAIEYYMIIPLRITVYNTVCILIEAEPC